MTTVVDGTSVVQPTTPVVDPAPTVAPTEPIRLDVAPAEAPPSVTEPAPTPTATDAVVVYEPTGDVGLDVALAFVGKLGISADHPAMQATANGDFSLIEAHLATMGDKAVGWQQMVQLAKDANVRANDAATAAQAAVTTAVHEVVGGDAQWQTIQAWASANADPAEKSQINAMFEAGPLSARAAATMLLTAYNQAAGTVVNPASATTQQSAGVAQPNNGPLSAKEFASAVNKLAAKVGGHNVQNHPEYASLAQRRAAAL